MGAGVIGHGLTEREQAVLSRADAGVRSAVIAEELKLSIAYVVETIRFYNTSFAAEKRFERNAIKGSGELARAIARTGSTFA